MALANYGDLKTSVATWLSRADLTSAIPDFVGLCHAQLMRELRQHPRMIKRNTSFSVDAEYEDAPSDFMELVAIRRTDGDKPALQFVPNDYGNDWFDAVAGDPVFVSITGHTTQGTEQFRFHPPPNGTYTMSLDYVARITFFAGDSATNWILTDHPDVYLYGSLMQAVAFLKDDARVGMWQAAYAQALDSLKRSGNRTRWSANGMQTRPA